MFFLVVRVFDYVRRVKDLSERVARIARILKRFGSEMEEIGGRLRGSIKVRSSVTVDTRGLGGYASKVDQAAAAALVVAAHLVADRAEALAPRRSGRLARSIKVGQLQRTQRGFAITVTATAPYAIYQELGTHGRRTKRLKGTTATEHKARRAALGKSGVSPHRYMRHALRGAHEEIVHGIKGGLR